MPVAATGRVDGTTSVDGEAKAISVAKRVNPASPMGVTLGGNVDEAGPFGVVACV